jgi:hypothetical protein
MRITYISTGKVIDSIDLFSVCVIIYLRLELKIEAKPH